MAPHMEKRASNMKKGPPIWRKTTPYMRRKFGGIFQEGPALTLALHPAGVHASKHQEKGDEVGLYK